MNEKQGPVNLKGNDLWPAAALAAAAGLLFSLGWWTGGSRAAAADTAMREQLLNRTAELVSAINPDLAKKLTFTAADRTTPAFELISAQLKAAGRTTAQRGVYTMGMRGGKIFFGPETYAQDDPMASPPGTEYEQPSAEDIRIFKDRRPVAAGPYTDEYGKFVFALAPVLDKYSGEVNMRRSKDSDLLPIHGAPRRVNCRKR